MPVLKSDADKAREILQDYHSRLTEPSDKSLRKSIERLTHIFKSDLFKALLDIQEYYEETLMNEGKNEEDKKQEWMSAHGIASQPHMQGKVGVETSPISSPMAHQRSDIPKPSKAPPPPPQPQIGYQTQYEENMAPSGNLHSQEPAPPMPLPVEAVWDEEVVVLNRGESGFGFSISGGVDTPHLEGDPSIYVTRLVPNGAAIMDGRLHLDDMIVAVNGMDVTAVVHDEAVGALKNAGDTLELVVRRRRVPMAGDGGMQPPMQEYIIEVELFKRGGGLGFSIAGGIGNEHIEGDPGIFVTRVFEDSSAFADGRIEAGDRLIAVDDISLEQVTHEDAVGILKATGERVRLVIAKYGSPSMEMEGGPPMQGVDQHTYANMPGQGSMDTNEKKGKGLGSLFKKKKK